MSDVVPDNFLGLPHRDSDYETARFAVLPIPYDSTTSYAVGTRDGPRAIISASQQVELYDEYLGRESLKDGVATLDPVHPDARGPRETIEHVCRTARRAVKDGKFLIGLGGEHSVSAGLVKAVAGSYKNLSVLQIDAHADMRDAYQGSPWSHACVMRRIHDMGVPAVGVGIRNYSAAEARFIASLDSAACAPGRARRGAKARKAAGYKLVGARRCRDCGAVPTADSGWQTSVPGSDARIGPLALAGSSARSWIGDVVGALTDNVYVTIDIDGFDPAYAPGTGTPEPGGLDWYQVVDLLEAVARSRRIVAADLVEVRPIPPNNVTEFLAAKLLYRLIGLV